MLLGFRSNKVWKKVVSSCYLVGCALFLIATIFSGREGQVTQYDFLINKVYGVILFLTMISPYIFLSNTPLRDKVPLFKRGKTSSSLVGVAVVVVALLVISGVVNGLHSAEYLADMENHAWREVSRTEPTYDAPGLIEKVCDYCGLTSKEKINALVDGANNEDAGYASGDTVQGEVSDIVSDGIREKLVSFGFTEDEAVSVRDVLLKCGINDITNAKATDPSATIDGLIAFRWEMDDKRTVWFTVDNREVIYIGLNGVDVYDKDKGGFLISVDDVHVPESDVSLNVRDTLIGKTESVLSSYFVNALWYDAWGVARSDDQYMVQCEVYAQNKLGIKDWVVAKVWYEYDGSEYNVTAVVIDGKRYK